MTQLVARAYSLALIATLIVLTGCSRPAATPVSAAEAPKRIAVPTVQPSTRTVPAGFDVTGAFAADESSDIAPLVAGRVVATPVNAGDFVRAGQTVAELDHRDAQLRVDQAKAQLAQATAAMRQAQSRIGYGGNGTFDPSQMPEVAAARAAYESAQAQAKLAAADARRFGNLVATGDVSRSNFEKVRTQQQTADAQANAARQQYEAALNGARQAWGGVEGSQAAVEAARAQLAQAEKALADTTIRAPFDGFITDRPVAAGEYVALSNKIATIVKIGSMKLELQAPEQRASQVNTGMTVNARVAAWPARVFTGKVTAVNPSVNPASRVFIVEARFDNPKAELRPGMFSTARVLLPGGENAIFVPKTAVQRDKTTDSYQLYTVENGVARMKVVVPGDVDGDSIRIVSGLAGNETVATARLADLYDGAPVEARQ
jgi:multidrug efflux pump subunit AcrA (membrane-fusion protein)